jgi:rRNA maturation RNase YbeY
MDKVLISKQGNYPVKTSEIKKKLSAFFESRGIVSKAEVNVAIVGEARMLSIGRKYLKDKKVHNVLSFTPDETKELFILPPDGEIHLGEIVVCFPVALKEAKDENVLINEKVYELIEHGALHLLGIHHK